MDVAFKTLRIVGIALLLFIVLCFTPVVVGMFSVLLGELLGCDFNNGTSSTSLCESSFVRTTIESGTMVNWYALATLPLALIAAGALLLVAVSYMLLRFFDRR